MNDRTKELAKLLFGEKPEGACVRCGSTRMKPEDYKDDVSRKEAGITGTCQACQDVMFAEPEDDSDADSLPPTGTPGHHPSHS